MNLSTDSLEEIQIESEEGTSPNEFANQMEQVFKAIDKNGTGVITLIQFREEIEDLGLEIESNPMISQLLDYLKIVHYNLIEEMRNSKSALALSRSSPVDMDMVDEDSVHIDFDTFLESMARFEEGVDAKETRKILIERSKLPKFKVPVDMLKKYNITPKGSPILTGNTTGLTGANGNMIGSEYSHLASPSKNKFGKMYSSKPIITFDQFEDLFIKLNHGKAVPKNKLLMFMNDLPSDADGCIDITSFIGRYSGLNHPMSPKLTFEDSDLKVTEQKQQEKEKSALEWNKNQQLVSQLQENYRTLEKECDNFQSEIQFLEKSKQQLEQQLRKKESEVDRLKKDAKFVEGMRDTNKELIVQNTNLKATISKLNNNEGSLRDTMESEKEKARAYNEQIILKDLEIKKLNHLLKTQQNINNKLSMMVTFSNETGTTQIANSLNPNDKSFTAKRIKPTFDKAKQLLSKQKSESIFDPPPPVLKMAPNISVSIDPNVQNESNAESLDQEFEQLNQQQQQPSPELDDLKLQLSVNDISLPDFSITDNNTSGDQLQTPTTSSTPASTTTSTPALEVSELQSNPTKENTTTTTQTPTNSNSNNNNTSNTNSNIQSPLKTSNSNNSPYHTVSPRSNVSSTTTSPRPSLTSNTYVRQSSPVFNIKDLPNSPIQNQNQQKRATITPTTTSYITSPNNNFNSSGNMISPSTSFNSGLNSAISTSSFGAQQHLYHSQNQLQQPQQSQYPPSPFDLSTALSPTGSIGAGGGSLKRIKKQDLIHLHMNELEAQKESAQSLIEETTQALADLAKSKDLELQRIQKMYQEEKQANKFLEKQLATQLDKNKELIAGKENNSWGGMQGFFSFVSYFLPSSLFCNVSSTS